MKRISIFLLTLIIFLSFNSVFGQSFDSFKLERDGIKLNAKLFTAEGEGPFTTVILLHGFPGNEKDVLGLGNEFSKVGINTLSFNYSGTYGSEGEFRFEDILKDIDAAFDFIRKPENLKKYNIDKNRIYLGGWSFGGGMTLTYAAMHPEINAVFSIAGNDHGVFFREYWENPELAKFIDAEFEKLTPPNGPVRFAKGARMKEITKEYLEKVTPFYDLRKAAPVLADKNILLIGGWDDAQVRIDTNLFPLYTELKKNKAENTKIVSFQDNHAFVSSRENLAKAIIDWINDVPTGKNK